MGRYTARQGRAENLVPVHSFDQGQHPGRFFFVPAVESGREGPIMIKLQSQEVELTRRSREG
jgi:hypothetical protein